MKNTLPYRHASARASRIWLGYVYVLATVLGTVFLGIFAAGIITKRSSLMFSGLFMCVSFALFWRAVGSRICRNLRRSRDRALALETKSK